MKFKSKKLTALAMAVLMAASTMSSAVFAEDVGEVNVPAAVEASVDEVAPISGVGQPAVIDTTSNAVYHVDPGSIVWHEDGTVDYNEKKIAGGDATDPEYVVKQAKGTVKETKDATCTEPSYVIYTIEIDGETFVSGDKQFPVGKALGHDWDIELEVTTSPTCAAEGTGIYHKTCKRCKTKETENGTIPKLLHKWSTGDDVKADEDTFVNVKWKDEATKDEVVLDNPQKDGTYAVYHYCKVCGALEKDATADDHADLAYPDCKAGHPKTIYAKKGVVAFVTEIDNSKIEALNSNDSNLSLHVRFESESQFDYNKIELKNCNVPSSYKVEYYAYTPTGGADEPTWHDVQDGQYVLLAVETYEIPAHHMIRYDVEYDTKAQKGSCTVVPNADGTVKSEENRTCNLTIPYYIVEHCTAKGCPVNDVCDMDVNGEHYTCEAGMRGSTPDKRWAEIKRTRHEIAPGNPHIIDNVFKKEIESYIATEIEAELDDHGYWTLDEINTKVKAHTDAKTHISNPCVKNVKTTATCTEAGKLTIEYYCVVCGTYVEVGSVDVPAMGHIAGLPKGKTTKEATCEEDGEFTHAIYCERVLNGTECGEMLTELRTTKIPRKPHTNETRAYAADGSTIYEDDTDNTETRSAVTLKWDGKLVIDEHPADTNLENLWNQFKALKAGEVITHGNPVGVNTVGFNVKVVATTNCTNCGHHELVLEAPGDKEVTVKITDVKKEDNNCMPGSITMSAEYVNDDGGEDEEHAIKASLPATEFDYYSSRTAYNGKVGHDWGPEKVLERVEPTLEADGKIVYGKECSVCHETQETRTEVLPKLEPVVPVEKPATVTGVKLEAIGAGRVNVSWNEVEGADYYVVLLHDSFEYKGVAKSVSAPKLSTSITGLDTEVFSHIWVAAVKKDPNGGKDVVGDAGQYQSILAREVPTVTGLKASAEAGKITLTWKAQSRANTYSVAWKSTADDTVHQVVVGDETTYTLENTTKNVGYYFWVYAGYTNSRTNKNGEPIGETTSAGRAFAGIVAK